MREKLVVVGSGILLLILTSACSPQVRGNGSDAAYSSYESCLQGQSAAYCNGSSTSSGQSYNQYVNGGTYQGSGYQSSYPATSSPYYGQNQNYGAGQAGLYKEVGSRALTEAEEQSAYAASFHAYLGTLSESELDELKAQWEKR